MRNDILSTLLFIAPLSLLIGCGNKEEASQNPSPENLVQGNQIHEASNQPGASVAVQQENVPEVDNFELPPIRPGLLSAEMSVTPAITVETFLDALQGGRRELAEALLTDKARLETARHNLPIKAPGRPSAQFEVGKTELISEANDGNMNGAYVQSTWSDAYDDGTEDEHEIVWILRHEEQGWRVAGMATQVFEDADILVLNFEDPEDMERQFQWVAEEENRRMQMAAGQQGSDPNTQEQQQAVLPQNPGATTQQQ